MRIFTILIFIHFSAFLFAQQLSISGILVDNHTNTPLSGAHISLLHPWGEALKTVVAEADGTFVLNELGQGGYELKVSFLGYADLFKEVTLTDYNIDLGIIKLKEGSTELSEVEVVEKIPLAQQIGDTTQYNADAYKTLPDADAQDLIEKMPGVVVQDGKIQAQGEDVKQVLVDGKPFFGQDPNAALKTLPAEVISKIQVFDQTSDQANFTGFDNGETTKTINIITRPNMRNGQFGKVYGGYGYEDRYQIGGNASLLDGKRRVSIIGQSNNLNIQNFATEDLLGVVGGSNQRGGRGGFRGRGSGGGGRGRGGRGGGSVNDFLVQQQGGIAQTHALGINYSDTWGKNFNISGSYFFNYSDNVLEENSFLKYIDNQDFNETFDEDVLSETNNFNHRMNFRIDYKIDSLNSIIVRPRLSFQFNDGFENSLSETLLSISSVNADTKFSSDLTGLDFSNSLLFRHRFRGSRRTFSINLRNGYNKNSGDSHLDFEGEFIEEEMQLDSIINQKSDLKVSGWNISSDFTYTEPIGEKSTLMFTYRAGLEKDKSDKQTFDFSEISQGFDAPNEELTNVFENNYTTHRVGTGYNWRKNRDFFLMIRANAQWANLKSDETFPDDFNIARNYFNVLPMAILRFNFSRQENLRFGYFTSTRPPSVEQLQNVIDNTNPVQISIGNPDLDQTYANRLFARYSRTNTEKATVFYAMITGTLTQNSIVNALYLRENGNPIFEEISLPEGTQLARPVNLDGNWNVRSFLTYGFPLRPIKTNLNIDLTGNFTRQPGLTNDRLNHATTTTFGGGLTFSSNISEFFDFTISSRSSYSIIENSSQKSENSSYWSQNSRIRLGFVSQNGLVIRNNLTHNYYNGLNEDFDQNYWLWTVGLGKKLFKNQRGELTISVFDILNQNQAVTQNITGIYEEETTTNVLNRYVMLQFTYNFRNFKTKKAIEERPKRERRPRW